MIIFVTQTASVELTQIQAPQHVTHAQQVVQLAPVQVSAHHVHQDIS